ncbi:MAG: hypothetical protein K5657_02710 [Desulfovibrio sp.]|nr:hypothetical protein [Desulfovibrio sp.]
MEIDSQQMEELLRIQSQQAQQTQHNKPAGSGVQFDSLLSEALGSSDKTGETASVASFLPPGAPQTDMVTQMLLNPIEQTQNLTSVDDEILQSAFNSASGTLDLWDSYAKALGSSQETDALKNASSILDTISQQVSDLKSSAVSMQNQNSGLNSLINELEIMTVTERAKINRGDYI